MSIRFYVVVPSSKISGGNREAFRLAEDLIKQGCEVAVLSMWRTYHGMDSSLSIEQLSGWTARRNLALIQLPLLVAKFICWLRSHTTNSSDSRWRFLFTHYATFPLSRLVRAEQRFYFVQDLEWRFVGNRFLSWLLRKAILHFYRRGKLISANAYLSLALRELGLPVLLEAPIWADPAFATETVEERDIDFVMMLRKGAHKRLDLYREFINKAKRHGGFKLGLISPDDDIITAFSDRGAVSLLRPSLPEMRALYSRSKCFIHLSDHEGFGLPPLEAMGAGCVPLCRDSGGVRAFMNSDGLGSLLLPATMGIDEIFERAVSLIAAPIQLRALEKIARSAFLKGLEVVDRRSTSLGPLVA